MTEEQKDIKEKNRIRKDTKEYMASVNDFLKKQNGGSVPFEYKCSLQMLETYYEQFLIFNYEIGKLTSLMIDSRYGPVPHPILKARDGVVCKLDMILKQLGITFKEQVKMKITDVAKSDDNGPLEKFMNKIEKR